jgi:hypothetical protein
VAHTFLIAESRMLLKACPPSGVNTGKIHVQVVIFRNGRQIHTIIQELTFSTVPLALESQMNTARWRAERPRERKSPGKTTSYDAATVADAAIAQPASD